MTRILFITSNRLGDAVLSTGILNHLIQTQPDPEIKIAGGPLVIDLFRPFPGVTDVFSLKKEAFAGHWRKLWRESMHEYWDCVVDLRNSIVSRLILSHKKYIWQKPDQNLHKVEQLAATMGLDTNCPPEPVLYFHPKDLKHARQSLDLSDTDPRKILAIAPAANWIGKTWPIENYIELLQRPFIKNGLFKDWRFAIFAAPGEESIAQPLLKSLPQDKTINMIGQTSPATAAACISQCHYFLGNDSGLMHCASATGVPVMGLFGPSRPEEYRPWGIKSQYVRTPETLEELTSYPGYNHKKLSHSLMSSLTVNKVETALVEHFSTLDKQ